MMWTRPLDGLIGTRAKVALLRFLIRTGGEHSGRELGRFTGLDAKTCHLALRDLVRPGVVQVRRLGGALAYGLNDRHVWVREGLAPLYRLEERLLADYADALRRRLGRSVVSILVFGSVARGGERPDSDLDLAIVIADGAPREACAGALDRALVELAARYGRPPHVFLFGRREFGRKARRGDSLVNDMLRTGRVLWGRPPSELMHGAAPH
jgi:predicted nucleotidyltransferase